MSASYESRIFSVEGVMGYDLSTQSYIFYVNKTKEDKRALSQIEGAFQRWEAEKELLEFLGPPFWD